MSTIAFHLRLHLVSKPHQRKSRNWINVTKIKSLLGNKPQMFLKMNVIELLALTGVFSVRSWECFADFFYDPPTSFLMPTVVFKGIIISRIISQWNVWSNRVRCSQRLSPTRVIVSGWLKSFPPESRNPQGAGPSSTTFCGIFIFSLNAFFKLLLQYCLLVVG